MLSNCFAFLAFVVSARLSFFFLFFPFFGRPFFVCMFFHCADLFLALCSRSCGLTGNKIFFIFLLFSNADLHPMPVPVPSFASPHPRAVPAVVYAAQDFVVTSTNTHTHTDIHTPRESKKKVTQEITKQRLQNKNPLEFFTLYFLYICSAIKREERNKKRNPVPVCTRNLRLSALRLVSSHVAWF